jgi:predicted nucleic acid-binding protein
MILVDTSVWADHLRKESPRLVQMLEETRVLIHPFVIGELACGNLPDRGATIRFLTEIPVVPVATHAETMVFLASHTLWGRGVGYIDMHLLASVLLKGDALLWTRDRRLAAVAKELDIAWRDGQATRDGEMAGG